MQLIGIHHLRPYNLADARRNHDFYTRTLGMRLVKKTVNQDDTEADAAGASPFWHLANVNRR
jgi:glyoxalase family protein